MILSRVIRHVSDQNWTAIAIDFVIVVAGVFMGLQAQEWNAARGHRVAESGYLRSMEEDVAFSIGSLERLLGNLEQQQAARAALYEYSVNPGATLAPDELDRLVGAGLFYLPQLNVRQVTFEALKSSGQLAAIRSPALVSLLQSLSSEVAAALRLQEYENEASFQFADPLLVGSLDMGAVFRQPSLYGMPPIPWLKDGPRRSSSPETLKSMRFGNAVLYRAYFTEARLRTVREILEQHRRIAELIDARQAELGTAHH